MEKLRTHQEVMESLKKENKKYKTMIEAGEKAVEKLKTFEQVMEDLKKISPEHKRMVETSEIVNKLMQQIVRERIKQGLSQRDLAEMTGLKQSAIARFETLETTPTIITLIKITNALNLSVNALTQNKNEMRDRKGDIE